MVDDNVEGVLLQGSGHIFKYGNCGCAKNKNINKIGNKSEKNRGWLITMLMVLLQGPGCISKYGRCEALPPYIVCTISIFSAIL
jgi:hypothetical protein